MSVHTPKCSECGKAIFNRVVVGTFEAKQHYVLNVAKWLEDSATRTTKFQVYICKCGNKMVRRER